MKKKISEVNKFKQENYYSIIDETQNHLTTLIKEKQNSTASIGVSLTSHYNITKALKQKDGSLINLSELSSRLRENTDFKNVWFQLISKDGISLQRSWSNKKGDKISKARIDIRHMIKDPKVMNTISVGRFDLTFKSMNPVFDKNKEFLGIIEVITHFNSITRKLAKKGTNSIVLADKKYASQLENAFTNSFIDNYYVANLDAKPHLIKFLKETGVKNIIDKLNKNNFIINEDIGYIITYHKLLNIKGQDMAHFIMFTPLKKIEQIKIKNIQYIYNLYNFLGIIFLGIIFYFLYSAKKPLAKKDSSSKILFAIFIIYLLVATTMYKAFGNKI